MWRRRRTVLNEAVHELRRPLQALALAGGGAPSAGTERSLRMVATALDRLDREINGGRPRVCAEPLAVAALVEDSVGRWSAAAASDRRLLLRLDPALSEGQSRVLGDRFSLAQALDNLVVNAIEHGGPRIVVAAAPAAAGRVRIAVRDCARPLAAPDPGRRERPALGERLRGRSRHGHGLRVVRRIAAAHGGSFCLTRSPGGAEAVLELPLIEDGRG